MALFNDNLPYFDEFIHVYGWNMSILWSPLKICPYLLFDKAILKHETIWQQNMLLRQKVMLISRKVIVKRARQEKNRQMPTLKNLPQYVACQLGNYSAYRKCRYATPVFRRLTVRAINYFEAVKTW